MKENVYLVIKSIITTVFISICVLLGILIRNPQSITSGIGLYIAIAGSACVMGEGILQVFTVANSEHHDDNINRLKSKVKVMQDELEELKSVNKELSNKLSKIKNQITRSEHNE